MPDAPPPNVKIYDRPARTGLPPLLWVVITLAVLVLGYFLYRYLIHPGAPQQHTRTNTIRVQTAYWLERTLHEKQPAAE